MKASAIANANIAFVKYWGKEDTELFLPTRTNLSMTKADIYTHTTIEFSEDYSEDIIMLNEKKVDEKKFERIVKHLNLLRKKGGTNLKAKVVSKNNFPTAAGMASSASGFAALTVAGFAALGLDLKPEELSIIARQGSGSACRSIQGGFNKWVKGSDETSYAHHLYDADYWDIRDIVVVVKSTEKKISSTVGMDISTKTCPWYNKYAEIGEINTKRVEKALKEKDFEKLGKIIEEEALLLHCCMMTTVPSIRYWKPETLLVMDEVEKLREKGIKAYYTIDAGPNVHIITLPEYESEIENLFKGKDYVEEIYKSKPGGDAKVVEEHLF